MTTRSRKHHLSHQSRNAASPRWISLTFHQRTGCRLFSRCFSWRSHLTPCFSAPGRSEQERRRREMRWRGGVERFNGPGVFVWTYRNKLLKADLLVLVGVSSNEGLHDFPHLVSWQGVASLSEQLLQLKVTHVAAVVDVWGRELTRRETNTNKVICDVFMASNARRV